MSDRNPGPGAPTTPPEVYERLRALGPAERTQTVLGLVAHHPQKRLELPARDGVRAILNEINLSDQGLSGVALKQADLRGASLWQARLDKLSLEQADFAGADLAGASLREAVLSEANFQNAMLEDADLRSASLRFARLQGCVLEGAKLRRADLWGAECAGAVFARADLRDTTLEEINLEGADLRGADLRGAVLRKANLRGANLEGADLQGATLVGADLRSAVLREAKLQSLVLTHCRLDHVHLSDAWLEKTRLRAEQVGDGIGEEAAGEFELARRGYLALERNFESLGDPDAAGWAFRKKRRMQKYDLARRARAAVREGCWVAALRGYIGYLGDQLAEWVCDYGESIPRVLVTLVAVYFLFAILYGVTGTVVRLEDPPSGGSRHTTYDVVDVALFSLTAMTAPGNPPEGLVPKDEMGYLLAGVQALLSIFLTGLLGFVAGNRIRR